MSNPVLDLEDALQAEKMKRRRAEHDARKMREIVELMVDQPGSKFHRKACRSILERTKNAPWIYNDATKEPDE